MRDGTYEDSHALTQIALSRAQISRRCWLIFALTHLPGMLVGSRDQPISPFRPSPASSKRLVYCDRIFLDVCLLTRPNYGSQAQYASPPGPGSSDHVNPSIEAEVTGLLCHICEVRGRKRARFSQTPALRNLPRPCRVEQRGPELSRHAALRQRKQDAAGTTTVCIYVVSAHTIRLFFSNACALTSASPSPAL